MGYMSIVRFAHDWSNGVMEFWSIGTIGVPSGLKLLQFTGSVVLGSKVTSSKHRPIGMLEL